MILLGREPATLIRRTQTRDPETAQAIILADDPVDFLGSFQPPSGKDLELLEEGQRSREVLKLYTRQGLRTAQAGGEPSDVVVYAGRAYEVHRSERYATTHPIPHFRVLLVRLTEGTLIADPPPEEEDE